jgi:hypothetical protein
MTQITRPTMGVDRRRGAVNKGRCFQVAEARLIAKYKLDAALAKWHHRQMLLRTRTMPLITRCSNVAASRISAMCLSTPSLPRCGEKIDIDSRRQGIALYLNAQLRHPRAF